MLQSVESKGIQQRNPLQEHLTIRRIQLAPNEAKESMPTCVDLQDNAQQFS